MTMKMKMKIDHIGKTYIDLGLDMDINILNIISVSVWWCAYMYKATLKQHLKLNSWKVKQHWGWVENSVGTGVFLWTLWNF